MYYSVLYRCQPANAGICRRKKKSKILVLRLVLMHFGEIHGTAGTVYCAANAVTVFIWLYNRIDIYRHSVFIHISVPTPYSCAAFSLSRAQIEIHLFTMAIKMEMDANWTLKVIRFSYFLFTVHDVNEACAGIYMRSVCTERCGRRSETGMYWRRRKRKRETIQININSILL